VGEGFGGFFGNPENGPKKRVFLTDFGVLKKCGKIHYLRKKKLFFILKYFFPDSDGGDEAALLDL